MILIQRRVGIIRIIKRIEILSFVGDLADIVNTVLLARMLPQPQKIEHPHVQLVVFAVRGKKRSAERVRTRKIERRIFLRGECAGICNARHGIRPLAAGKRAQRERCGHHKTCDL